MMNITNDVIPVFSLEDYKSLAKIYGNVILILVEGATDERLMLNLFRNKEDKYVIENISSLFPKEKLIQKSCKKTVIYLLNQIKNNTNCYGIVDKDYDDDIGNKRLLTYKFPFLETTLVMHDGFKSALYKLTENNNLTDEDINIVRKYLLSLCHSSGVLKRIFKESNIKVPGDIQKYIYFDKNNNCHAPKLIADINKYLISSSIERRYIEMFEDLSCEIMNNQEPENVCYGHDLIEALCTVANKDTDKMIKIPKMKIDDDDGIKIKYEIKQISILLEDSVCNHILLHKDGEFVFPDSLIDHDILVES